MTRWILYCANLIDRYVLKLQRTKGMVPGGGVEPPRTEVRRILSPLRLPVPPSRRRMVSNCCRRIYCSPFALPLTTSELHVPVLVSIAPFWAGPGSSSDRVPVSHS